MKRVLGTTLEELHSVMRKAVWSSKFYVKVYQLARTGMEDSIIAKSLGVSPYQFNKWVKEKSGLRFALVEGRKSDITIQEEYVYGRLNGPAKLVWDQIRQCKGKYSSGGIDRLLEQHGESVKKMLFLHCLMRSHFNATAACRKINVSYKQYKEWIETDYEFANAIQEMQWHKGNLYERALDDLIHKEKDPAAIIFANKTFNKGRGYGEKLELEHTGEVKNTHVIELGEELLNRLSKGARGEIMQVMDQLQIEQDKNVVEAVN